MVRAPSWHLLLRQQRLRARDRRYRARPTDVEREVGDGLDELLLGDAVFDRLREVELHLLGLAGRDESGAGDEASVPLRELRPLPDVAEQDAVGDLDELRREAAEGLLHGAGRL